MLIQLASGSYKNLSGSAAISTQRGSMTGFYVNSTSSGVIQFLDGGSGGTALDGQITPAIGWHFFPATFTASGGPYLSLVSGSINVTVVFNPTPLS